MTKQRITIDTSWMRHILCLWLCMCCVCGSANAEVITLRSGETLRGEVLLQNEEVVIIRLPDGAKYQYPAREIASVETEETALSVREEVQPQSRSKKAALHTDISSGAAYLPGVGTGGFAAADILVGTHDLMHKQVFLGGGIGYHAVIMPSTVYSFIPVQAAAFIPFTTNRHAPVINMALGYGFAVNNHTKGGIYTELGIGWRYRMHENAAFSLSADVQWQQAQTSVTEVIDGNAYSRYAGVNMLSMGIKIGLHF